MEDPDWTDIRACQAGDREAFTRVMARHGEAILRQMRRFTPEAGVQEELAQDVFVEAWLSVGHYRPKAPFLHWLQTLATRVGYRYWKELQRRRKWVPVREDDAARTSDPEEPPESLAPEDAAARLGEMLDRLPPDDRLVLIMTYYDNLSAGEIATRMGWNAALVRMRAFRARKKLRKWLTAKNEAP